MPASFHTGTISHTEHITCLILSYMQQKLPQPFVNIDPIQYPLKRGANEIDISHV